MLPNHPMPPADQPIWGIKAIGLAAGVLDEDGSVNERKTKYRLQKGLIRGVKVGARWVSYPRWIANLGSSSEAA